MLDYEEWNKELESGPRKRSAWWLVLAVIVLWTALYFLFSHIAGLA